jgi:hypothetical protein
MRRNTVDVDVPTQLGAVAVRQHIGKFAGQSQRGTVATKVNTNTIFKGLSLHIIGSSFAEPSIACATCLGRAVHDAVFFIFLKLLKYSVE